MGWEKFRIENFIDPPREFSILPFWFINKVPSEGEIREQIDKMRDKHVYGFFIHARRGLDVPPLKSPPKVHLLLACWAWFSGTSISRRRERRWKFRI